MIYILLDFDQGCWCWFGVEGTFDECQKELNKRQAIMKHRKYKIVPKSNANVSKNS